MSSIKEDILLLSTADWDNPFWTNKQYVALELSRLGHKVLYVDSIGLRPPSLNKSDISRIFRRLLKGLRFPKKINDNLWVWSPIVIPFQKYRIVRVLNKWILYFFSKIFTIMLGLKKPLLWTYNPMTLDIFYLRPDAKVIYHCVDEIKAQPGMPVRAMEVAEDRLLKRADYVFVTSEKLYATRKAVNSNTFLFSNVADYEHFSRSREDLTAIPDDVTSMPRPVIGFVGAISSYKVDFELLTFIARSRPDWSIVLIGKVGEGEPDTNVSALELDNIYMLGPRAYQDLPGYIKGFDVAIIPVVLNEYTHAMFPMKFFEYLAAGKQVVSTKIDSLKNYDGYVYLSDSHNEFLDNLERVLSERKDVGLTKRLALAKENTYESRTKKMLSIINETSVLS